MQMMRVSGAVATLLSAVAVAVVVMVSIAPSDVLASHFAYGTVRWSYDSTVNPVPCNDMSAISTDFPHSSKPNYIAGSQNCVRVNYVWQLAWRRGGSPWNWSPSYPIVGTANMGTPGYETWKIVSPRYNSPSLNMLMICKSFSEFENWFYGEMDRTIIVDLVLDNPMQLVHASSARLINILEGNGNINWRIQTTMQFNKGTRSPISTALPRIYARSGVAINFRLPAAAFDGFTNQFFFAPTSDSSLSQPRPQGGGSAMALDQYTGRVQWTPINVGLYATQYKIVSYNSATPPADQNSCPLDLLYQVEAACSNCPTLTITFVPASDQGKGPGEFNCYVGYQTQVSIRATLTGSSDLYSVSLSHT